MGFKARKNTVKNPRRGKTYSHLDTINEQRFEYDLPPISREDHYRSQARYMYEKHDYDIGS